MVSERRASLLDAFTAGNHVWGQNLLEFSLGRDFGALKGLTRKILGKKINNIIGHFFVLPNSRRGTPGHMGFFIRYVRSSFIFIQISFWGRS